MFNIGPLELGVLGIVALLVIGPERLPGMMKDAANFLRTMRDLATGARQQLKDELGPEFADLDLRNLNPRTAVTRAVFGDDFDPDRLNPRTRLRDAVLGDEDLQAADPRQNLREARENLRWNGNSHLDNLDTIDAADEGLGVDADDVRGVENGAGPVRMVKPNSAAVPDPTARRPRPSPRPRTTYDDDAT